MPNRLIRDGFVDSSSVASISDWAHRVYSNMLIRCDDAGRMDGRLEILRPHLFPLGTKKRNEDLQAAIDELAAPKDSTGKALPCLLIKYEHAGRPYLQLTKVQRYSKTQFSKLPFADGTFRIEYVKRETRDGFKEFVATSLADGVGMGSAWGKHPIPEMSTYTDTSTSTSTISCGKPQEGEESPSKPSPKPSPRPRNVLFDAVADAWFAGKPTTGERSLVAKLARDLGELGATPAEIEVRRQRIRARWGKEADTATSVAKHWRSLDVDEAADPEDDGGGTLEFHRTTVAEVDAALAGGDDE